VTFYLMFYTCVLHLLFYFYICFCESTRLLFSLKVPSTDVQTQLLCDKTRALIFYILPSILKSLVRRKTGCSGFLYWTTYFTKSFSGKLRETRVLKFQSCGVY
jgi:hypothetical protein